LIIVVIVPGVDLNLPCQSSYTSTLLTYPLSYCNLTNTLPGFKCTRKVVPRGGGNVGVAGSNHLIRKGYGEHPVNVFNLIIQKNFVLPQVLANVPLKLMRRLEARFRKSNMDP
jgi:hypothetical protein